MPEDMPTNPIIIVPSISKQTKDIIKIVSHKKKQHKPELK